MLKIALGNQARRAPEFPQTLDELTSTVKQLFGDRLISPWVLTYREPSLPDVEMIIDSEEEYENYRNNLPQYKGNPVIFIRLIEKTKSALQNTKNNQLEPVEEEPEFQSQISYEETSKSIDFNDLLTKKMNSSSQNDFEQILQDKILEKEDSRAKGIDSDFKEKVMKVILEQLPLIVSHVEKSLQEKKFHENHAPIKEIHQVQCSGCQKFPIIGARYQCLVCQELNFCEKCEESQNHVHPFVKIRRREQQDFLPQSLNNSQCSIYPGKEAIMSLDQIYRAGIKFPSSLDLNKMVTKRNPEEVKSERDLNFCDWGLPKDSIEVRQNTSQKRIYEDSREFLGMGKSMAPLKPGRDVENFGVFKGGKRRGLEEEASKSSSDIIEVLKEIDGGKKETFAKIRTFN